MDEDDASLRVRPSAPRSRPVSSTPLRSTRIFAHGEPASSLSSLYCATGVKYDIVRRACNIDVKKIPDAL